MATGKAPTPETLRRLEVRVRIVPALRAEGKRDVPLGALAYNFSASAEECRRFIEELMEPLAREAGVESPVERLRGLRRRMTRVR